MAKKNDNSRKTVVCDQWVQITLLPEHVEEAVSQNVTYEYAFGRLLEKVHEGYSLLTQYDQEKSQWSVRLAGIHEDLPNKGKLLYGNGITEENAIMSLYIKVFLVSKNGIWVGTPPASSSMS